MKDPIAFSRLHVTSDTTDSIIASSFTNQTRLVEAGKGDCPVERVSIVRDQWSSRHTSIYT